MRLRSQTIVFLGGTLLVLSGTAALVSYLVFRPEFERLEREEALKDLGGVAELLSTEIAGLENSNADWARWDKPHGFLLGLDSTFVEQEIRPETFGRLALDQMVFFDTSGTPVLAIGSSGGELVYSDPAMEDAWRKGGVLSLLAADAGERSGLMLVGGRTALASIRSILTTEATGPRSGSLAFVRLLPDSAGMAVIPAGPALSAWISEPRQGAVQDTVFSLRGRDTLAVSAPYPGLDGSVFVLGSALDRDLFSEAGVILDRFVLINIAGGVLFAAVTLLVLQLLVVRKLRGFLGQIRESGAAADVSGSARTDELSSIGMAIGPVLEKLETMTNVLRRSEQNNAALIRMIPDFMVTLRRDGTILSVKQGYGFEPPLPVERLEGMRLTELELVGAEHADLLALVAKVLEEGAVESMSLGVRGTDATMYYDIRVVSFGPDTVLVVARDVTQRMKAEEAAARLQRLESLGLLAGGIAHDFNNRLSTAIGSIELAMADIPVPSPTVLKSLERALDSCTRAGDLARKLLTFSTGGSPYFKPVTVGDLAHEALDPLFRGIGVTLRIDVRPGTWLIDADADQMSQLFRNLATNAIEAIAGFGWFEMKAFNSIDPQGAGLQPGHYVTMEFCDSGPGIREDLLKKVFEPYFTTKEDSPGLGLSMCHSIAVKHGGWLEALPGPGGRFLLQIPAARDTVDYGDPLPCTPLGGNARILVMDDDLQVLETIKEMLETLDYSVETATDGGAALYRIAEAQRTGRPFDVLILDLVVPGGIGGLETLARARAKFGDVRAIVSSGYSSDSVLSEFAVHGFKAALRKPFNLEELSSTVRRLLRSRMEDDAGGAGGHRGRRE